MTPAHVARIYMRVSTAKQSLDRQDALVTDTKAAGYHIAGIYREKASGARPDRPELRRMIGDLQPGEIVVAERIDRISRLPLTEAQALVDEIRAKGAKLAVPGLADLDDLVADATGVSKVVLESVQDLLLRVALQMARDDYEDRRERQRQGMALAKQHGKFKGRPPDTALHERIVACRRKGFSIRETAEMLDCSPTTVKKTWSAAKAKGLAGASGAGR